MKNPNRGAVRRLMLLAAFAGAAFGASAAPVDDAVQELQREWEVIRYQAPAAERQKRFETLAARAHQLSEAHPGRAEPLVWEGIVVSSLAGEKGGLGALSLAKQAKGLYEQAIRIDGKALDGSAYNSLGVLYYKVPGWPVGFGDKAKARELLQQALEINPKGHRRELLLRRVPGGGEARRGSGALPGARAAGPGPARAPAGGPGAAPGGQGLAGKGQGALNSRPRRVFAGRLQAGAAVSRVARRSRSCRATRWPRRGARAPSRATRARVRVRGCRLRSRRRSR